MLDPFDPINYQPPLRPIAHVSIGSGPDRQADEMAELTASLDALLAESDPAPGSAESTMEDGSLEAAVTAAEASFIQPDENGSPVIGVPHASTPGPVKKLEEFPELAG